MTPTAHRRTTIAALVASLAIGFVAILHFGADANWDLRNYHLYNPYALIEGRLDTDVFPMLQAYLNPALDIPFYLAVIHLGIYPAHAILGLYLGLFIWVVFLFNRRLFSGLLPDGGTAVALGLTLAATVIGVTGAAGASQAITTFNEIQTALLVVASLTLILPDAEGRLPRPGRMVLAGLLMGLAVGLKLTAMVYLVGACVALLPWRLRRAEIGRLALYGFAAAGGILVAHGAWSWVLYERFGNPVFPFFNAIFRSPFAAPVNFADMRFFPEDAWNYLTYPLAWAFTDSTAISELPFRDPRMTLLLGAALVLVAIHLTLWRLSRAVLLVIVFAVASYAVWLVRFAILRYGVPLEVMAGTLLMLCVAVPIRARAVAPAVGLGVAALGAVGLVAGTHWPNWGRVPLSVGYTVTMQPVPDGATVLLVNVPVSHIVPLMPGDDLRFVGVNDWSSAEGPRRDAAMKALAEADGTRWALVLRNPGEAELVAALGWRLDGAGCTSVEATMDPWAAVDLCPLVPAAAAGDPAR